MAYEFRWKLLGGDDSQDSGRKVPLALYTLMRCALKDVLKGKYGKKAADEVFYTAGKLAGAEFYTRYLEPVSGLDEFINKAQELLKNEKIGVLKLKIEKELLKEGTVLLSVDEDITDADLYGFGPMEPEICICDEGLITALFEHFTRKKWQAKEIDCWCTGARTCRFLMLKKI